MDNGDEPCLSKSKELDDDFLEATGYCRHVQLQVHLAV